MGQVPHRPTVKNGVNSGAQDSANDATLEGECRILLVGAGRLARSFKNILGTASNWAIWSRNQGPSFRDTVRDFQPTHVWLAIGDRSITEFAHEHAASLLGRTVVHFSGSTAGFNVPKDAAIGGSFFVHCAHPLSTFTETPMTKDEFASVPFVLDVGAPDLKTLLPGLTNTSFHLRPEERAYYHALCASAGGFTVLLWEAVAKRFTENLGLPAEALLVFQKQIALNLAANLATRSVLTGPLARGDHDTIQRHREALRAHHESPLLKIYDGFSDLHRTERQPTGKDST
jgi:predicted short-subunit dehydrogenase-like oxidoreductase (DUF2520 family)